MEDESDSRRTGQAVEGVLTAKPQNLGYGKDVDCRLMKKLSGWTTVLSSTIRETTCTIAKRL